MEQTLVEQTIALSDWCEESLKSTVSILELTSGADDPLAVLFRTVLEEQKKSLENLIPALRQPDVQLSDIKNDASIVYRDHEVAHAKLRAWVRMLEWNRDPRLEQSKKAEKLSYEIKSDLEKAAIQLELRFGFEEVKYVVPALYNPEMR
ncbi:hypothetical protein [Cohnella candidum]|uniref:Uncharacterized protein n=1 Tax=Cohnella candidum TaxID=2674991 RepID=A0A3G3JVT8_9BACL|nr:hypothetical protein [Cohnella candidum]AYQ72363.1 hypothetical protein EAV92_07125 [Cohnella candidum]